jgi:hypothetical protein
LRLQRDRYQQQRQPRSNQKTHASHQN